MRGGDGRRPPRKASVRRNRRAASPRTASALRTVVLSDRSCPSLLVGSLGPLGPPELSAPLLLYRVGRPPRHMRLSAVRNRPRGESEGGSRCDSWSGRVGARTLLSMASARGVRGRLEEVLSERILVLDGAMGTAIQSLELSEEEFRGARLRDHARDLRGDVDV